MNFRPNPLMYGANENFLSSFKIVITLKSLVDREVLSRSVAGAMKRYPYFSICPVKEGNRIILRSNPRPVPVFDDGRCTVLGSEETNGHMLTFGCEKEKIILNASHFIADGMGIVPLLNTVLYLYVSEMYGTEGLCSERINMPDDNVMDEEYEYIFSEKRLETDSSYIPRKLPEGAYLPVRSESCDCELYSYHLHIPQKAMMSIAQPSDGSPVSFLSVMMYRALCSLDDKLEQPVVAHVQHQYRPILNAPLSRHSLVSYIPVVFPSRMKDWSVERQNTIVRGQIIYDSEPGADISAVKRLISVFRDDDDVEYEKKKQAMCEFIDASIHPKTFGISYVGKMDWCGLDQYVDDIHVYLGEKNTSNMFLMEVMTIGADFSVNFMQNGSEDRFVNAFIKELTSLGIPVRVVGKEKYTVCDTTIPS